MSHRILFHNCVCEGDLIPTVSKCSQVLNGSRIFFHPSFYGAWFLSINCDGPIYHTFWIFLSLLFRTLMWKINVSSDTIYIKCNVIIWYIHLKRSPPYTEPYFCITNLNENKQSRNAYEKRKSQAQQDRNWY